MKETDATDKHPAPAVWTVHRGETATAWALSGLKEEAFPGEPAPAEDRVQYRFINGFVDAGDLPCRKAFWTSMVGRPIAPDASWPSAAVNLPGPNRRVEFTGFWYTPTHVSRWARGVLLSDRPRSARFRLATCGGVRIWVNGHEAARFEPFRRNTENATEIELPLKAGRNDVLVHTEDLAERDTVWFFELELLDEEPLAIELPLPLDRQRTAEIEALARGVRPARDVFAGEPFEIAFDTTSGTPLPVRVNIVSHDHGRPLLLERALPLPPGETHLAIAGPGEIPDGYHAVRLSLGGGPVPVVRNVDAAFLAEIVPPEPPSTLEERKRDAMNHAARFGVERAGRLLAMLESGLVDEAVRDRIIEATLASIDRREDCSDFVMVPLLWVLTAHGKRLPEEIAGRIRQSVLGYRYWVDEPGNDVMWFWSENHTLCFHVSQLLAGQLLADDVFSASGRTGREQATLASGRLGRWFDSVEAHGLAEWNSAAYYPIDFIGLLALERWAEPGIAGRARKLLDAIFTMTALHTLAGVPAGSQGRAYDKELRAGPLTELAPFARVAFGKGWLNSGVAALPMFCAGSYTPPDGLRELAALEPGRSIEARYSQGLEAAKLVLYKTEAAQLSTVVDHKTGKPGYQQHVVDVLLSGHPMARLWINHPGEDDPWGHQRPSYWAGNGMLPRVSQYLDVALLVHDLGDARLGWTHAYFGRDGLDEVLLEKNWVIVRSGRGFAALHASNGLEPVISGATAGRELRSPGRRCGWAVVVGSGGVAEFSAFAEKIRQAAVLFDAESRIISLTPPKGPALALSYEHGLSLDGAPKPFEHHQPQPVVTYDSARGIGAGRHPLFSPESASRSC